MMFRRFVATWLMLSILGYGMVAAADVHNENAQSHDHAQVLADVDSGPAAPLDQQTDSDHCCHGIAHLLGFASETTLSPAASPLLPIIRHTEYLHSLALPPAYRPPITA